MRLISVERRDERRLRHTAAGSSGAGRATPSAPAASPAAPNNFQQILDEVLPASRPASHDLKQLWSELPEAERALIEKQSDQNLARYRELVRAIARETLKQNVRLKKIRKRNRHGDEIELSVVEFIDDRLQRMANLIHAPGNSAFQILKAVEEIRGILIDVRE